MSAATSASDRYDAARKELAAFESARLEDQASYAWNLADAIRALIEPPATNDKGAFRKIADEHFEGYGPELPASIAWTHLHQSLRDVAARAYQAGIQAAWESWEPENAPGHGQCWEYGVAGDDVPETAFNRVTTSPRPEGWTFEEAQDMARSLTRKSQPTHVERRIVTEWEKVPE